MSHIDKDRKMWHQTLWLVEWQTDSIKMQKDRGWYREQITLYMLLEQQCVLIYRRNNLKHNEEQRKCVCFCMHSLCCAGKLAQWKFDITSSDNTSHRDLSDRENESRWSWHWMSVLKKMIENGPKNHVALTWFFTLNDMAEKHRWWNAQS